MVDLPTATCQRLMSAYTSIETLTFPNWRRRCCDVAGSSVDASRLGASGHSMGGGGTLEASLTRPSLKAALPLAPWDTTKNFSNDSVPTLIVGAQNDTIAPVGQHAKAFYNSLSAARPRCTSSWPAQAISPRTPPTQPLPSTQLPGSSGSSTTYPVHAVPLPHTVDEQLNLCRSQHLPVLREYPPPSLREGGGTHAGSRGRRLPPPSSGASTRRRARSGVSRLRGRLDHENAARRSGAHVVQASPRSPRASMLSTVVAHR